MAGRAAAGGRVGPHVAGAGAGRAGTAGWSFGQEGNGAARHQVSYWPTGALAASARAGTEARSLRSCGAGAQRLGGEPRCRSAGFGRGGRSANARPSCRALRVGDGGRVVGRDDQAQGWPGRAPDLAGKSCRRSVRPQRSRRGMPDRRPRGQGRARPSPRGPGPRRPGPGAARHRARAARGNGVPGRRRNSAEVGGLGPAGAGTRVIGRIRGQGSHRPAVKSILGPGASVAGVFRASGPRQPASGSGANGGSGASGRAR